MATEFIKSDILTKEYVLTSEASSIGVTTDQKKLGVTMLCFGTAFFTASLYAYAGKVELIDPGSIIEDYFRANNLNCEIVTIAFGTAFIDIKFIYCEQRMPESFDATKVYLLSSTARRVHKGSKITVAAIPVKVSDDFLFTAIGHDAEGNIASQQFNDSGPDRVCQNYDVDGMIKKATKLSDVMYFSVNHGGRQLMCYLSPSSAFITFRFRNIFNVQEMIDIEGAVVTKTEVSRQEAICSGNIVQYDRKTDRAYQVTTGPMPADEVESLNQLVASHFVQICVDNSYYDVVIQDHTCEDSTEGDSLSVVKFTWRFVDQRPVNFTSSIFGIGKTDREIFSGEYSSEYD
ncbi:MAG: hypothetical protein ACI4AK_09390 [Lepagella sp.]